MASRQIPSDGPIRVEGLPERTEELSLIRQGPMTRLTLWQEIMDNHDLNGKITGHYFSDAGFLLLDLQNGSRGDK